MVLLCSQVYSVLLNSNYNSTKYQIKIYINTNSFTSFANLNSFTYESNPPLDTERKLNVHRRLLMSLTPGQRIPRRPGRLLNVLHTFILRLVPKEKTLNHFAWIPSKTTNTNCLFKAQLNTITINQSDHSYLVKKTAARCLLCWSKMPWERTHHRKENQANIMCTALRLVRVVGILSFWGRSKYFKFHEGVGGQFILRPFSNFESKISKIQKFSPAVPLFSIFTFSDLRWIGCRASNRY